MFDRITGAMREWSGRAHVETLRVWPELSRIAERIAGSPEAFLGALLIGSLSRGGGDTLSDIDLIAVAHPGRWDDAWEQRTELSNGALATFDRFEEGKDGVAGHSWLTDSLVKVECLIAEPGRMRVAGNAVVLVGEDDLLDRFESAPPITRTEVREYASELRETEALQPVEQAYDDLIALLRREVLPRKEL